MQRYSVSLTTEHFQNPVTDLYLPVTGFCISPTNGKTSNLNFRGRERNMLNFHAPADHTEKNEREIDKGPDRGKPRERKREKDGPPMMPNHVAESELR